MITSRKNIIFKAFFLLTTLTHGALGSASMVDSVSIHERSRIRWVVDTDPSEKLAEIRASLDRGEIDILTVRTKVMNRHVQDLLTFLREGTFSGLRIFNISFDKSSIMAESKTQNESDQDSSSYKIVYGFDNTNRTDSNDPHRELAKYLLENFEIEDQ